MGRIFVGVLTGLIVLVTVFEDKLIFFPAKYPEGDWNIIARSAREGEDFLAVEDCYLTTSDGVKIHGWMCSPQRTTRGDLTPLQSDMVMLFFHGNAGNITGRYEMIRQFVRTPARALIIDYRGYGKSEGSPSERGVYLDARAAWDYLTTALGVPPDKIVLFGESLGGAVAIDLALRTQQAGTPCGGLIIQSSFTSIPEMAATVAPYVPRLLLRTKMASIDKIGLVRCPKLFIHSRADEIVPFEMGWRLFSAASDPKRFYEIAGAGHNETDLAGGRPYFDAISEFVRECRKPVN